MMRFDDDERTARQLLTAVQKAGCRTFLDDGDFMCAPPLRRVEWDADVECALDDYAEQLRDLLMTTATVH